MKNSSLIMIPTFDWNEDYKDKISSLNVGLDIGFGGVNILLKK